MTVNDVEHFDRVLHEKLDSLNKRRQERRAEFQGEMAERERRIDVLDAFALEFMQLVAKPRLEKLIACFENARLRPAEPVQGCHCGCELDHTAMFPASTTLDILMSADESASNGILSYRVEILPVFFQFEKEDHLSFPLSQPNQEVLADWLDKKLLTFVETYMRLADDDSYQRDNLERQHALAITAPQSSVRRVGARLQPAPRLGHDRRWLWARSIERWQTGHIDRDNHGQLQ